MSSSSSSLSSSSSSLSGACGITLKREAVTRYVLGRTQGFRLRVTCLDSPCTIDEDLFVYQRFVCPVYQDVFVAIASPADFEEYPVYVPGSDLGGALFNRRDSIDLLYRSMDELEDAWTAITNDVAELSRTMQLLKDDNLTTAETVLIDGFLTGGRDGLDHYCVRSGILVGRGGADYTIQFVPPFTRPPVFTATPDVDARIWITDDPTVYQVKIRSSIPLNSSCKVYWNAIGY